MLLPVLIEHVFDVWSFRLPEGPIVRLESVSDDGAQTAWRPDGTTVTWSNPFPGARNVDQPRVSDRRFRFTASLSGIAKGQQPSTIFRVSGPRVETGQAWILLDMGSSTNWTTGFIPQSPIGSDQAKVEIGATVAPWRTVDRATYAQGVVKAKFKTSSTPRPIDRSKVRQGVKTTFSISLPKPTDAANRAYRIVAFDARGKAFAGNGSQDDLNRPGNREFWYVGKATSVTRVEIQARDYVWHAFPAVQLKRRSGQRY